MKWYVVIGWERPHNVWRPRSIAVTTEPKREGAKLERMSNPPEAVHAHGPYASADEAQEAAKDIERRGPAGVAAARPKGRLTLTAVRAEARKLGFTVKSRDGEFVVTPLGEREGERSYYTNDLDDVVATMRVQADRRWEELRDSGRGGGYERKRTGRYVYRRYTLTPSMSGDVWFITRDGVNVGSALTAELAEEIVDGLY